MVPRSPSVPNAYRYPHRSSPLVQITDCSLVPRYEYKACREMIQQFAETLRTRFQIQKDQHSVYNNQMQCLNNSFAEHSIKLCI